MASGEASKFAGCIVCAAQKCFNKLGRTMIRPFYAQQYAPLAGGRVGPMLALAVKWWLQVLEQRVVQVVPTQEIDVTAQLFCDAFIENEITYTSWAPSEEITKPRW